MTDGSRWMLFYSESLSLSHTHTHTHTKFRERESLELDSARDDSLKHFVLDAGEILQYPFNFLNRI